MLLSHCEPGNEILMRRSAVVQQICEVVTAEGRAAFGNRMIALILTGSAARGEATIVNSGHGWDVLGDAEFLAVLEPVPETKASARADTVMHESMQKLRALGIRVTVDLGLVDPPYLKGLPPHIFSHELRSCGKVVFGDPSVLRLIPRFSARDILCEDAWRLLCNRMIEQLRFVRDLEDLDSHITDELHYATVKLFLDMATSYLVFAESYAPSYCDRAKRLDALADDPCGETPFPLRKFATRVEECTAWKLSGDEQDANSRLKLWREAISYMRRLWRWELIQLTGSRGELTIAGLSRRFAQQQELKQRLRGWASVAKRRGWLKSARQWPRWMKLGFRSSPRYLVYQAAAEVAFRLPCLIKHKGKPPRLDVNWDEIRKLLPESRQQSASPAGIDWREVADDILWNYSEFLRDTRA